MFIRPHLEYSIQATHPILCRDAEALEKVQKLALKFVKGLRHVPYEAALKQICLFSLTHRRIRGGLVAIIKITHDLLGFPTASTFAHPTRKGLRGHAYKFHQQRCCTHLRQIVFTIRAVPFWNKLPAEIVNAFSVKSFKTLLDAHWQSPKYPSNLTPLTTHSLNTHRPKMTLPKYPRHPTWSVTIVFTAS